MSEVLEPKVGHDMPRQAGGGSPLTYSWEIMSCFLFHFMYTGIRFSFVCIFLFFFFMTRSIANLPFPTIAEVSHLLHLELLDLRYSLVSVYAAFLLKYISCGHQH